MSGSRAGKPTRRADSEMVDFYGVNSLSEVNKARRLMGLPPVVIRERECLRCEKSFTSHGRDHRMCSMCRHTVRDRVE